MFTVFYNQCCNEPPFTKVFWQKRGFVCRINTLHWDCWEPSLSAFYICTDVAKGFPQRVCTNLQSHNRIWKYLFIHVFPKHNVLIFAIIFRLQMWVSLYMFKSHRDPHINNVIKLCLTFIKWDDDLLN